MNQTIAGIGKTENLLTKLIERDIQLLRSTAVQLILKAKEIFVIGFSSSSALAYFIQFRLVRLGKRVHWIILTGGPSLAEQLAYMKSDDLLIAIGFLRASQTAMDHAMKVGAPMLGITDSATPIAKKADLYLLARRGFHTTVNSMTAPFSVVNALVLAIAGAKKAIRSKL